MADKTHAPAEHEAATTERWAQPTPGRDDGVEHPQREGDIDERGTAADDDLDDEDEDFENDDSNADDEEGDEDVEEV